MLSCWNEDPLKRPSFPKLVESTEMLLTENTKNVRDRIIRKLSLKVLSAILHSNINDHVHLISPHDPPARFRVHDRSYWMKNPSAPPLVGDWLNTISCGSEWLVVPLVTETCCVDVLLTGRAASGSGGQIRGTDH